MIADAKNLQVSGKVQVFQLVSTISNHPTLETTGFLFPCVQVRATPPRSPLWKRPDTRAHLQCSRAQLRCSKKNSTSCTGTSGDCRGRKRESVPIDFGNAKHKNKAVRISMCVLVVTRLRRRRRAAPLFWPSHRPVSQNMELL